MNIGTEIAASGAILAARELAGAWVTPPDAAWSLEAMAGRFVELSGTAATAALTLCAGFLHQAQQRGGLVAWIAGEDSTFYPPDLAASGIDLAALPVIRVADMPGAAWVADALIRSSAFALVVVDVRRKKDLSFAIQTRLVGLAQKHHTVLLAITHRARGEAERGSLVSLRGETGKKRAGHDCFLCEVRAVKDKRRAPGWTHAEVCRGPDGLC